MLRQAVDDHTAAIASSAKPQPSGQQRSPLHNGRRPLSVGTGNIQRTQGIKRTSSGLAKALESADEFADNAPLKANSQANPIVLDDDLPSTNTVYFDENDFSSDIELEMEHPAAKTSLQPPTKPAVTQAPKPSLSPVRSKPTKSPERTREVKKNAGFGSITGFVDLLQPPSQPAPPASSNPLPWSSSPPDHYEPPAKPLSSTWKNFRYQGPSNKAETQDSKLNEKQEEKPRATKRRTLPWLEQDAESQSAPKTPALPGGAKKPDYAWNTTASAMKEQQKSLRQANRQAKKDANKQQLIKNNKATDDGLQQAKTKKRNSTVHRVFLSEEQQHVLNLVVEGKKSVFFTGSAGTGKSVLLREIISALRKKHAREPDRVAVTASTGLAACNVGGVTLHSFAGIGLGKEDAETLVKKIRKNQKAKHRWMRTKVLIVDEVSMVDGELFDKLENIARVLRNNGRPFGGIQLIITGDFFQLPPVPDYGRVAKFAFDASTWNTAIEHTIALHHVFRQKDPVFANMLNEMREGRLTPESNQTFRGLSRSLEFGDQMEATELFSTRAEVENANSRRMSQLSGEVRVFDAKDGGTITDKAMRDKLLSNCLAPEVIHLKKGAQVMLIKNIDETLVNGSLGKVIGFMSEQMFDRYHEDEEEFLNGPGGGLDEEAIGAAAEKKQAKSRMEFAAGTTAHYPVVRFAIADGTTRDLLCQRESWKIELPNGEVQASRAQIPLILAWALSIHKAQGQTLERVKVNLGRVFEKGQAYVALSRATSMAGLQVLNFDPRKVNAHERVRHFYASLSRAEQATGSGSKKVTERVLQKATRKSMDDFGDFGDELLREAEDAEYF